MAKRAGAKALRAAFGAIDHLDALSRGFEWKRSVYTRTNGGSRFHQVVIRVRVISLRVSEVVGHGFAAPIPRLNGANARALSKWIAATQ